MTSQTELIQEVEKALEDAGIDHELQSAKVVDSFYSTDGHVPAVVDINLRIHR